MGIARRSRTCGRFHQNAFPVSAVLNFAFPTICSPAPAEKLLVECQFARANAGRRVLGLMVAAALVLGAGSCTPQAQEAPPVAIKPHKVPKLETVPTSAMPSYEADVARSVDEQLARVPAAERAAATKADQPMHQYRELAKRFWTAEALTEYLTEQARTGKTGDIFARQVELVQAAWENWDKALVYSYKFGPVMTTHLDLMTRVARQQQERLTDGQLVARSKEPLEQAQAQRRAADVSDMLAGLLPVSPVTKERYNTVVRHVQL